MSTDVVNHPTLGRLNRDPKGGFFKHVRVGRKRVRLSLDCGYEGPEHEAKHLEACLKIAAQVRDRLESLLTGAAEFGSRRCLAHFNRIRVEEENAPVPLPELIDDLKILDVCIMPDHGCITFVV